MRLNGDLIYLIPISKDDTENIVRWRNNPEVRKNFIFQEKFTKELHEQWMDNMVSTGKVVQFIIYDSTTEKPVGSVYIRDIDNIHNKAEYGIFIGEDSARGKGFGSEAAKMMIHYAFHEFHLHKLTLRVLTCNERGIHSYENAGFVKEAYLKDEVKINSKYFDIILMGIINHISDSKTEVV